MNWLIIMLKPCTKKTIRGNSHEICAGCFPNVTSLGTNVKRSIQNVENKQDDKAAGTKNTEQKEKIGNGKVASVSRPLTI